MSLRSFTIYDIFQRNADLFATDTALVCGDRRIDFGELRVRADRLAAGLAAEGVQKGDRVAILGLNSHRFFYLFGAAASLGAVVVPINWRLATDEIRFILADAAPKVTLLDAAHAPRVQALAADGAPTGRLFGFDEGVAGLPAMARLETDGAPAPVALGSDDPFVIIYTAAVDGRPRGAVLSHGNLVSANLQTAVTMGLTRRDAFLNMLPLFHITDLNLALAVMHVGGKNVVAEKFDARQTLALTTAEKISVLGSFPPILSRLLDEMSAGDYDVSSLRHVKGIDNPETIQRFQALTGGTFWILYGQSETTGSVTLGPALERPGAAGRQLPMMRIRLVDDADRPVAVGHKGEITVQGPLVFQGFWRQPELDQSSFRNGWHHTGDLGRLDGDGYLWFEGRKPEKELIKPGGENVYPAEVESVILEHPAVAEVSVIGVPDPQFGEGIKAVCVLKPGADLSADALAAFVASKIARYKKPRYVEFTAALPKDAAGQVDRARVKALHGGAGASQ
jgi:acyl-CoA synthetase (AMP-forming)/AMP-acid ligase II